MKYFLYRHSGLFSIIWTLVIFVLCATPGKYIPSAGWLDLLSVDKLVHAGIFYVLCTLFFLYVIQRNKTFNYVVIFTLLGILYGAALEWMQATFFIDRTADWLDIVANSFGCLIAFSLFKKLKQSFV